MGWVKIDNDITEQTVSENTNISEQNAPAVTSSVITTDQDIQEAPDGQPISDTIMVVADRNDKVLEVKKDITADELKEETPVLEAPINWTDPQVWHDPTFNNGVIVKVADTDRGEKTASDAEQSSHKIDAIYFPLIKINQKIIPNDAVISMRLISEDLLPRLYLTIFDNNNSITNLNSAGADNEIVIVITSPVNGTYKKIKLPFYIDSVSTTPYGEQRILSYSCGMKIPKLKQKYPNSMNYPNTNQWAGCDMCKQPEQKIPNSWELLHFIAKECELGFASTSQCKEISDRNWRLPNSYSSLEECLEMEKQFAGDSEETAIFDWWVDLYGYIVMVNLPWVLNSKITNKNLGIYGLMGIPSTSENTPEQKIVLVNRTISNTKDTATFADAHNLMIESYKVVTNNELYELGTCSNYNIFIPGKNTFQTFDVQVEESSVTGFATEKYLTRRVFMQSIDMSGTDRQRKKSIFKRYFQNKRAKMLVVQLERANLGLQRGTLINVIIVDNDPRNKSIMANNSSNIASTSKETEPLQTDPNTDTAGEYGDQTPSKSDYVNNASIEMPNQGLSGLYYIDGVTYEYNIDNGQKITQTLKLIKKGIWGNFITSEGYMQIDKNKQKS